MIKERTLLLFLVVSLMLCISSNSDPCPQLCQQCNAGICISCYDDWTSNAQTEVTSTCSCPLGYYMNSTTRICNFCPVQCISCSNYTTCITCLQGYNLRNGICVSNFTNNTIQFGFDLSNTAIAAFSARGFSLVGATPTLTFSTYFTTCGSMAHQPLMGKYAFDYNTIVYKTYYGLPFHQWAQIKFQYFIIDEWDGEDLIVQVQGQRNNNPTTFTTSSLSLSFNYQQSIRNTDFCAAPQFKDNLGLFNNSFPHTDSILKFRISTSLLNVPTDQLPPNYASVLFGIREVLLIIGTCPSSCLTCASKTLCGSCAPLYTLTDSFKCICDTSVAYLTSQGKCIKKCQNNAQIFVHQKCTPCSEAFPGCLTCAKRNQSSSAPGEYLSDYMCTVCQSGKFLYSGTCLNQCPVNYYEKFIVSASSLTTYCDHCPQGCYTCEGNQYYTNSSSGVSLPIICSSCLYNYFWYRGQCFKDCPSGTYKNNRQTTCLQCPEGCLLCTSAYNCTLCMNNASYPVSYVNQNNMCVLACQNTLQTIFNPSTSCQNVTCSANCINCMGGLNIQCYECRQPYLIEAYSCVPACSPGYFLESALSTTCIKCRPQCKQCDMYSCSKCSLGFWLYNGQCVKLCPFGFYPSTENLIYKCLPCLDINCHTCIELPLLTNTSPHSQCVQCSYGFFLDTTTNNCVRTKPTCPIYYYYSLQVMDCVPCPAFCQKCQSSLCLLCDSDKLLNNGQCLLTCPPDKRPIIYLQQVVNSTNVTYSKCIWTDPLCETYNQTNCIQCIYLQPSLVMSTNNASTSCSFSCPDGFSRSSTLSQNCTIACPTNCIQCNSQARCLKCNPGYLIHLGNCVSACPQYYFSDSVQCIQCDSNCFKCQQDGRCIQCATGLLLSASGNCYSPGCSVSQYNGSLSACAVCTSPCLTCTGRSTQCTSCIPNYVLESNFICNLTCPAGQFIDTFSKQCRPCRPTCKSCTNFENCTDCVTDYYLFRVMSQVVYCISECPSGTYIQTFQTVPTCSLCKFPCLSCYGPNNYQCLQCVSGYKMDFTTCLANCPSGKYADQYGHCDLCHYSCKECFGPADFQCVNCFTGDQQDDDEQHHYHGYQYEGKCYENNCPLSTYYNYNMKQCISCPINCVDCSSFYNCTQCSPNMMLYNNSCVQLCPSSTFYNLTLDQCSACNITYGSMCSQCTASGCVKCATPNYRYNKTCVSACPTGTYISNNDDQVRQCLPCPQSCSNCTSPTSCKACKNRIKLQDGVCLRKCDPAYYYNSANNSCQPCSNSSISNCAGCYYNYTQNALNCIYCDTGYILIRNSSNLLQCIAKPINGCPTGYYYSEISKQCSQCHVSCISCTNSSINCTQCLPGLILVNNLCINQTKPPSCVANCVICSNTTTCTLCNLPYYLFSSNGSCVSQCPIEYFGYMRQCVNCGEGCLTCSDNAFNCASCKSGYYLLDHTCLRQCPYGYFVTPIDQYTAKCQSCTTNIEGCQLCTNSTNCVLCQMQYSLHLPTGKCYKIPLCPFNYFFSYKSDSCVACPINCFQCLNSDVCIACESGFIEYNGTCFNTTSCPFGTFLQNVQYFISSNIIYSSSSYTGSQCSSCSPPCKSCFNQKSCKSCLQGYILANSSCIVQCGAGFYATNSSDPSCQKCSQQCLSCRTNSTTCTGCHEGFFLFNKNCVADCPIGMFESLTDNMCRQCGPYCVQCLDSSVCLICFDGLWLLDGGCVASCPTGYAATFIEQTNSTLFNRMVGICVKCVSPCSTCLRTSSQYQCLSCINQFYLYQTRCLQTCPVGYFTNSANAQCTKCPSWCVNCTSYSSCQTCNNTQCKQSCQLITPSTCASCESACKTCDRSTVIVYSSSNKMGTCLQCYSPYFIYVGRCLLSCPSSTYLRVSTNQCINCSSCLLCGSDGTCIACSSTQYLYNGVCYTSCPTGTIPSTNPTNATQKICILNPCINSNTSSNTLTTSCSYCLNPYLLYNQACVLVCPNGTYQSYSSNTCEKCSIECASCSSYNNCTACRSGYYMQGSTSTASWICVAQCMAGTYLTTITANNTVYNICKECTQSILGCQLCLDYDSCILCNMGFSLFVNQTTNSSICLQYCPSKYYSDSGLCKPCVDPSCIQCTFSSISGYECLACTTGTFLVPILGKCVSQCIDGYYVYSYNTTQECRACPPQCLTCLNSSACIRCSLGFSFDSSTNNCVSLCPFGTFTNYNANTSTYQCKNCSISTGCSQCIYDQTQSTQISCISCANNWYLLNGICYQYCPSGYYNISGNCKPCDSICKQCSSASNCTKCYPGFNLTLLSGSLGSCISQCVSPTSYFQVSTQSCQACSSDCYQCFGPRFDQCISCHNPLLLMGSTCVLQCMAGYIRTTAGICVKCDSSCKQCTGMGSSNECTLCPMGTFLYMPVTIVPVQGQCLKSCPIQTYSNLLNGECTVCSEKLINCLQCSYNSMNQSPTCTKCSANSTTVIINDVLACMPPNYTCPSYQMYLNPLNQCVYCPAPCIECSIQTNGSNLICYKCSSGYVWENGKCLQQCPKYSSLIVQSNIIYNNLTLTNIQTCLQCSSNCLSCQRTLNATVQCTVCQAPYILYNNNCVQNCGNSLLYTLVYNQNTLVWQCVNTTQNIQNCKDRGMYSMTNSSGQTICVDVCPINYYTNTTSSSCLPCSSGCQICSSPSSCVTCLTGFYSFNNTQCLSQCPQGFIGVGSTCYQCASPCLTCVKSLSQCASCIAGYKLLEGSQCVQNCPAGYYQPSNTLICAKCNSICSTCSSNTSCDTCINPSYSPPCTDTTNQCLSNQYRNSSTTCASCSSSCATCYGPSSSECSSCSGSFILMGSSCVTSCLSGYYSYTNTANNNQLQCKLCSQTIYNCATCSYVNTSILICTLCKDPYLLSPDGAKCVSTCSQLNTNTSIYSKDANNSIKCAACIPNCTACTNQICYQCLPGTSLYNSANGQQCVVNCPTRTFLMTTTSGTQCAACGTNCSICINNQNCVDCVAGYVISNGQCVTSCGVGLYPALTTITVSLTLSYTEYACTPCNSTLSQCKSCTYNNITANTGLICTLCQLPYIAINGVCTGCSSSYYYDVPTQKCLTCNNTCLTCTSLTQCTSCKTGLFMYNGQCVSACPIGMYADSTTKTCLYCSDINCAICSSLSQGSQCSTCKSGYLFVSDATALSIGYTGAECTLICPPQTAPYNQKTCEKCSVSNCMYCPVTLSTCQQCLVGYYLIQNSCVTTCPSGTTNYNDPNGPDLCINCKTGCTACNNSANTCNQCAAGLSDAGDGSCQYNNANSTCPSGQYVTQVSPLVCSNCYASCKQCIGGSASQCISCNQPSFTYSNGYCISVCASSQFYNNGTNLCQACTSPCKTCVGLSTNCTSCITDTYLISSNTCSAACPANTYKSNTICKTCPSLCATCQNDYYCITCTGSATIYYNNICYSTCPTGTYVLSTGSSFNTCIQCTSPCLSCSTISSCSSCIAGYYLYLSHCVVVCPSMYYANLDTRVCDPCSSNCQTCVSSTNCTACIPAYSISNGLCIDTCPIKTYNATISGIQYCMNCTAFCTQCTSLNECQVCEANYILFTNYSSGIISCVSSCPTGYNITINANGSQTCFSDRCTNCQVCVLDSCNQCVQQYYLQNGQCGQNCVIGFYGSNDTWKCQTCMENCIQCPNSTYCSQCTLGYNFSSTLSNQCVRQEILVYGQIANISGFTSNITEITSLVYLSTSAGPVFFGQMSSTYFNIEFCQFMFFHDGVAGSNSQMKTFLSSLSVMSMSSIGDQSSSNSSNSTTSRLLLETEALSFLTVNLPILIMMVCFASLFGLTHLIGRYIDSMCLTCPNFNFYVKEICIYLSNRFKWIYFDFVVWLSYLPFLYFAIVQLQKLNFSTPLAGFSSILSIIIIGTYPLYPFLICYNIKKNYVALCMQNDKMVEMSLSPWVWKVKRPSTIPVEGEPFTYISKDNFKLLYYPLKYFRKFIFVLVVSLCPTPIVSLSVLLGLNIVFICYMVAMRPRLMPYIIFDFILEGVMLAFEIFMLIYMLLDSVKITAMSIVTHAFGFISANLSIIVAIVLNIVAYYKIFMCIYELYQHLKQKVEQKEKLEAKQKDPVPEQQGMSERLHNNNQFLYHENFELDEKQLDKKHRNDDSITQQEARIEDLQKPERDIANLLNDKDLIINNIQPRYDGEINNNQDRGLFEDKQLYGDQMRDNGKDNGKNKNFQVYEDDQLPSYKIKKDKKKQKPVNKKQNPFLSKQLNQTNQNILKKKQQLISPHDLQDSFSEDRINLEYKQKKGKSTYDKLTNSLQGREKERAKELKQFGTDRIRNIRDQQDINTIKISQKGKRKKQGQDNQKSLLRNQSNLSSNSRLSQQNLLNDSPNRQNNKNMKQFTKIEVKEGKYYDRNNKKLIKPIENQFDEIQKGITELNTKNKRNQKKMKASDQKQDIQQINFNQRKNQRERKDNDEDQINQLQYNERVQEKNRQNVEGNKKITFKQLQRGKNNKISNEGSQKTNELDTYERNNKKKLKNKDEQDQIQQINTKNRNPQKQIKKQQNNEEKLDSAIYNERKSKDRVKGNFFDDDQPNQPNYQQINRKKNQSNSNEQLDEGILYSRKAHKKNNQAQPELLQGVFRSKDKKGLEQIKKDQKEIQRGHFTENLRIKPSEYKIELKGQNNNYNTVDFIERQKNNKNHKSHGEPRQNYTQQGLLKQRKKVVNIQSYRETFKNEEEGIQQLNTIEKKKNKNKKDGQEQDQKQEQGGFFSKLFGFNKKQNKIDSVNSVDQQSSSKGQQQIRNKGNKGEYQQFQESDFGSKKQKQKNKEVGNKRGNLNMKNSDDFNEDYQQIRRKNQESIMKPKFNGGTLNFLDSSKQFQDSSYSRQEKRMKKSDSREKDSGLSMNRRGSEASDSQDFTNSRAIRAQNKHKNRSKANLNVKQRSDFIQEDDEITRKKKEEQLKTKRGGKGRLQIVENDDQDELENIQL